MRITDEFAQKLRVSLSENLEIFTDLLADIHEEEIHDPELEFALSDVIRTAHAINILGKGNIYGSDVHDMIREFYISLVEKSKIRRILLPPEGKDPYEYLVKILFQHSNQPSTIAREF